MEVSQHAQALVLWHITTHCLGMNVICHERGFEALGCALHIDKDNAAGDLVLAQKTDEQAGFLFHGRVINRLPYEICRDFFRLDAHEFRFVHMLISQF